MSDAPRWLEGLADGSLSGITQSKVQTLTVTSGHVVACDPLVFLRGADPFAQAVPPGKHAVVLGRLGDDNAFAMLRLAKRKIARWEVARCPGEEDLEGWPGFGVDSGVGCFVDQQSIERFVEREERVTEQVGAKLAERGIDPGDVLAYHAAFEEERARVAPDPLADIERELDRSPAASVVLDEESKGNLVAFRAGAGDGVYASFWGLDRKDQPVCLVTDFGLLSEEEDDDEDELSDELPDDLDDFDAALGGSAEAPPVSAADLAGLEALAAALASRAEPEVEQGPSPLFLQTKQLVQQWIDSEKIELEPDTNVDTFAEALLEKLVSLSGHRHPGSHVGEWLLERPEVADVFATDDELEADLKP